MVVIADTSPLNYLILIGHADLLPRLCGEVTIPRLCIPGLALLPDHSTLNALPDFLPVVVCQPSHSTHITLQQRNYVKPKPGRSVQARCLPVPDLIIGWAQRINWLRRNQSEHNIWARTLIDARGQKLQQAWFS